MTTEAPLALEHSGGPNDNRVLLLPSTQRDGQAITKLLTSVDIPCQLYRDIPALCAAVELGAAAIVVSEEALLVDADTLTACIRSQPVWSDLPIIILSKSGIESQALSNVLTQLGNVSVVERPVRLNTFLSIIRTALRARARQYQFRQQLIERSALLESERSARTEAQRISRMKDEFLATLSHELRTPLNAILGWTQIMKLSHNSRPADTAQGIEVIERNARAQAQIIEDLLDMSRIISGKVRLELKRVDLPAIMHASVDTARPTADAKGIRLESQIDPLAGDTVRGDANRLQQIMWNLLSNAIKFTPQGGRVAVRLQHCDGQVEIRISDNGEGIRADFLPYVFDRFRQADSSTMRRHGGLGLGLSIVKQLVELHGGSIRVTSDGVGKGSTFTVTLPLATVRAEPTEEPKHVASRFASASPDANESGDQLRGLRILVVDDEPDARSLVQRLLEDCDANITTAGTAAEALELVEANRFDVLISDIGMPGMDGYTLIHRLRTKEAARAAAALPAIALTAYARAEDRQRVINAGFQMHLAKPFDSSELVTAIVQATVMLKQNSSK